MPELPDSVVTALFCLLGMFGAYGAYLALNTWLAEKLEWRRQRDAARALTPQLGRKVEPGQSVRVHGVKLTNTGAEPMYVSDDEEVRRG